MNSDPFDIDRLFREIEKHIESSVDRYGAYKYSDNYSTYNDSFIEDDDNIYMTVDIGIEPETMEASIQNGNELVVSVDYKYDRIKLPKDVEKVTKVTCINGILDIEIKKKEKDGKGKSEKSD